MSISRPLFLDRSISITARHGKGEKVKVKRRRWKGEGEGEKVKVKRWKWKGAGEEVKVTSSLYFDVAPVFFDRHLFWGIAQFQPPHVKVKVKRWNWKGEGERVKVKRWRWKGEGEKVQAKGWRWKSESDKFNVTSFCEASVYTLPTPAAILPTFLNPEFCIWLTRSKWKVDVLSCITYTCINTSYLRKPKILLWVTRSRWKVEGDFFQSMSGGIPVGKFIGERVGGMSRKALKYININVISQIWQKWKAS